MEPSICSTPQIVGTGKGRREETIAEKPSGSNDTGKGLRVENTAEKPLGSNATKEKASSSTSSVTTTERLKKATEGQDKGTGSSKTEKGNGICLVCALGTKGSHTYQKECKKIVGSYDGADEKSGERRKKRTPPTFVGTCNAKK